MHARSLSISIILNWLVAQLFATLHPSLLQILMTNLASSTGVAH